MTAVAIRDLSKSYGRTKALDAVSFSVEPGEVAALLGLNGAGKSTLFQILTGLFVADAGSVAIFGHDLARAPIPALTAMGMVFQAAVLDVDLSVAQNLRFYAGLHGLRGKRADTEATAALGRFRIADLAGQKVRELSGGTRRKIEIARALMTRPPLLLLDEPSAGLDTQSRRDLVRDLVALAKDEGTAILWSTHLVDEVEAAAKVIVLHRGRVLADGTPAALAVQTNTATLEAAFLALTRAEPA
ncbi:ATP-binding cassette domain-containing protein [Beijerinckia sp. L45]|uniref:ATP-binding cassette domain-containing protein n=1 Tax=Beijerinckia sp. L45 TaxID=1641855 RepID=UPI00131EC61A|nr:ATP-binding cassette domain-containing protein [Beijerinckia sp. L45]